MSWQTPRQAVFNLGGPFLSKRAGNAGDLELEFGGVYTAAQFHEAGVSDRIIQQMYAAHWLDMAPAEALEPVEATPIAPEGEKAPDGPEKGPSGEVTGEGAPATVETPEGGAAAAGEATAPTDTVVTAYKCAGFGAYYALNAAGEKLSGKLTKTQAEGLANSAQVPLLGQTEKLPETTE